PGRRLSFCRRLSVDSVDWCDGRGLRVWFLVALRSSPAPPVVVPPGRTVDCVLHSASRHQRLWRSRPMVAPEERIVHAVLVSKLSQIPAVTPVSADDAWAGDDCPGAAGSGNTAMAPTGSGFRSRAAFLLSASHSIDSWSGCRARLYPFRPCGMAVCKSNRRRSPADARELRIRSGGGLPDMDMRCAGVVPTVPLVCRSQAAAARAVA